MYNSIPYITNSTDNENGHSDSITVLNQSFENMNLINMNLISYICN
jgi:hypothetical protein